VILAPDLSQKPAVDFLAPDGVRLQSTIMGIALIDPASGKSVFLGEVQKCSGEWVSPSQVIYANAFDGLLADVRYTLRLSGLEQDVILREQIPPEVVAAAGIRPDRARIAILTEFFDPPEPTTQAVDASAVSSEKALQFGAMTIPHGQAFALDAKSPSAAVPTATSWERLDGRPFLVETVDYVALGPLLDSLPLPGQARAEAMKSKLKRTAALAPAKDKGNARATIPTGSPRRDTRRTASAGPNFRQGSLVASKASRAWASLDLSKVPTKRTPGVVERQSGDQLLRLPVVGGADGRRGPSRSADRPCADRVALVRFQREPLERSAPRPVGTVPERPPSKRLRDDLPVLLWPQPPGQPGQQRDLRLQLYGRG
jgi:hypothetical protein